MMKKIFFSVILCVAVFNMSAQTEAYRGGIADGHSLVANESPLGPANVFQPYFGGNGDGYSLGELVFPLGNPQVFQPYFGGNSDGHSLTEALNFDQFAYVNAFSPFAGGRADGFASDSIINFPQFGAANNFSPYRGSLADGYAGDSVITFNPRGYITMYQPYSGSFADGWTGMLVLGVTIVPIELVAFTGEQINKVHVLKWTTSQEINTDHFELERSFNGRSFEKLGKIAAAGNSNTEKNYRFDDRLPQTGNNYYRLKIFDTDGSFDYSNVILLKVLGDKSMIAIYPNPTTKTLNISLGGAIDNSAVNATIYDMSGRFVQAVNLRKTNTNFAFDVNRLMPGMYNLRIQTNGEVSVFKFIKQ